MNRTTGLLLIAALLAGSAIVLARYPAAARRDGHAAQAFARERVRALRPGPVKQWPLKARIGEHAYCFAFPDSVAWRAEVRRDAAGAFEFHLLLPKPDDACSTP